MKKPESENRLMNRQQGFTLIELLVVVTIVGIIASIAVPGLRRARQHANSGSAIQSLRTVTTAEYMHERTTKEYVTLNELYAETLINGDLADGYKSGYLFSIEVAADSKSFACTATPETDTDILDHFFVDQTGVIRYSTGAPADSNSEPIPR